MTVAASGEAVYAAPDTGGVFDGGPGRNPEYGGIVCMGMASICMVGMIVEVGMFGIVGTCPAP